MAAMKFGLTLPYGDARKVATMAREAEEAGWDGIFVGDAIWTVDPMIQLAAAAMTTSRIRLGTMVLATPLRRPWHLASESLAVDLMSEGRLILSLGMGATWMGWQAFPDVPTDTRTRAGMLDETIDILTKMFQREQFDYDGKHYHIKLSQMDTMHYPPKSVQQPRIPLWVVGVWPRMKSMQRVLKCDGLLPAKMDTENKFTDLTPADLCAMQEYVAAHRTLEGPFDIVVEGRTSDKDPGEARDKLVTWREAGATWWIESNWGIPEETLYKLIRQGPPQL